MLETVTVSGHDITLRRMTVAEVATLTLRSSRHRDDRDRATAELLAAALSYGVQEAPEIGVRPATGWPEAQLQRLAELIGTGPWIELGNRIVEANVHLGSLRGKSAAPSVCAPPAETAHSTAQTGAPMLTTPAASAA